MTMETPEPSRSENERSGTMAPRCKQPSRSTIEARPGPSERVNESAGPQAGQALKNEHGLQRILANQMMSELTQTRGRALNLRST